MCLQVSSTPLRLIFSCPSLVPPPLVISQQLILHILMCPQRKDNFEYEKSQVTKNWNVLYHHPFKRKKECLCAIA